MVYRSYLSITYTYDRSLQTNDKITLVKANTDVPREFSPKILLKPPKSKFLGETKRK